MADRSQFGLEFELEAYEKAVRNYRDGLIQTVRFGRLREMPSLDDCLAQVGKCTEIIFAWPDPDEGQLVPWSHVWTEREITRAWFEAEEVTREERARYAASPE